MSEAKSKVMIDLDLDVIEVEFWCSQHIEHDWINTNYSPNPFVRGLERRCFLFAEEADATLFLLKWGGTLSH